MRRVAEKIQNRQGNPRPSESSSVEGFEGCFRFEIDEYRVIYRADIGDDVLLFAALGKLKDERM